MEADEIGKLADLEDQHWWYQERRAILDRQLRQFTTPGAALDIGACCGGNTRVLVDNGWRAMALDYSRTGPEICRTRGVTAVQGDATRLPVPDASLDLVVAYDILEHIPDHVAAVREAHRVLRPGGQLLVAVPADPELWSAHDVAVLHCRRYTSSTLNALISGNGFVVSKLWNWNVLMKPALKLRRDKIEGSDLDQVPPVLNSVLRRIIRTERYLPLSKLPGVSLFLQAQALPVGPGDDTALDSASSPGALAVL